MIVNPASPTDRPRHRKRAFISLRYDGKKVNHTVVDTETNTRHDMPDAEKAWRLYGELEGWWEPKEPKKLKGLWAVAGTFTTASVTYRPPLIDLLV